MKNVLIPLTTTLLCAAWLAPRAETRQACPDQVALHQPGSVQQVGPVKACGLGLTLFERPLVLPFVPCPARRITVPRHEVCVDVPGSGTRCRTDGLAPVLSETCDCASGVLHGFTVHVPLCVCGPVTTIGVLDRLLTESC